MFLKDMGRTLDDSNKAGAFGHGHGKDASRSVRMTVSWLQICHGLLTKAKLSDFDSRRSPDGEGNVSPSTSENSDYCPIPCKTQCTADIHNLLQPLHCACMLHICISSTWLMSQVLIIPRVVSN